MTDIIVSTASATWVKAKKTKGLIAKPARDLFDSFLLSLGKVLINTLEGEAIVDPEAVICVGPAGDIWQQSPANLFKKYNLVGLNANGWLVCEPKPENEVECFEFVGAAPGAVTWIQGNWGKTVEGVGERLQRIETGDRVCRNPNDHSDQWVVKGRLFVNTYELI